MTPLRCAGCATKSTAIRRRDMSRTRHRPLQPGSVAIASTGGLRRVMPWLARPTHDKSWTPFVRAISASRDAAVATGADRAAMAGLVAIAVVMVVLTGATVPATRAGGDYAYVALALVAGGLALAATRLAERRDNAQALWLIVGTAIVLRGMLLVAEPLLSTDVYRYVWDGKVQAA